MKGSVHAELTRGVRLHQLKHKDVEDQANGWLSKGRGKAKEGEGFGMEDDGQEKEQQKTKPCNLDT